jgi:hypothetical protein
MKENNLTYEWLEFLALQKSQNKHILNEQETVYKASQTNPGAAKAFGDFEYVMVGDSDVVRVVSNPIPKTKVNLFCTAQNKVVATMEFHSKYAGNLEKAYREGSTRYCPLPSPGSHKTRKVRSPESYAKPFAERNLSNHSFGTAVDFNYSKNPYKKGNRGEIESYPEFITAFENNGFRWLGDGGDSLGRSGPGHPGDDMHFDIRYNATPEEFSLDINQQYGKDDFSSTTDVIIGILGIKESINKKKKSIFRIKDSKDKIFDKHKKYFMSLLNYIKKELQLNKEVKIVFEDDEKNSKSVLGRTGGYLNQENKIHIFITGRHIKDIMRSLAHELVHHKQNIRGEFKKSEPTTDGYAQKNPHLRKMEREAFLKGNMLFRDWEDNYKYKGEK